MGHAADMVQAQKKREKGKKREKKPMGLVTRIHTVHLNKFIWRQGFRKRARKAVAGVRTFARRVMFTDVVKIDPQLNKFLWSRGCCHTPRRVRVKLSRRRSEEEDNEGFYTYAEHVPVSTFKGLNTIVIEDHERAGTKHLV